MGRTVILIIGSSLIILGVFLPWGHAEGTFGGIPVKESPNGIEVNEGVLSLALGAISGMLVFVVQAAGGSSARLAAIGTILLGVIVVGLGLSTMSDIQAAGDFSFPAGADIHIEYSVGIGLYIAMAGGIVVALGGLLALIAGPVGTETDPDDAYYDRHPRARFR